MKHNILKISVMLLGAVLFAGIRNADAAFSADGNFTVTGVTFGSGTVDMLIMNGSGSASWEFDSGAFTVIDPGTVFKIGSSSASVVAVSVTKGGSEVACENNATPGTSSLDLPNETGTYTVVPKTTACAGTNLSSGTGSSGGGGGGAASTPAPAVEQVTTPTAPVTTPPATLVTIPATPTTSADTNLSAVMSDAIAVSGGDKAAVLAKVGKAENSALEAQYTTSIVSRITASESSVPAATREKILTFVTYGTPTTDSLGAGERGGVVNSFKEAFGKLPQTDADWEDVVKIANGRWPGQTDVAREKTAESNFKVIYKRNPVRSNAHDDAAVVVMAYGLRPRNRNMNSEKAAIKSYEAIFKRSPQTATAWDAVRAISYSGATR